jgi:hypothetical protein
MQLAMRRPSGSGARDRGAAVNADALRDAFAMCLEAGSCSRCATPLNGEAVWIADDIVCVNCGRMHGDPSVPRVHAVWRPGFHLADAVRAVNGDQWA